MLKKIKNPTGEMDTRVRARAHTHTHVYMCTCTKFSCMHTYSCLNMHMHALTRTCVSQVLLIHTTTQSPPKARCRSGHLQSFDRCLHPRPLCCTREPCRAAVLQSL